MREKLRQIKQVIFKKEVIISICILILVIIAILMLVNKKGISEYINKQIQALGENVEAVNEIGEKGTIASAQIIQTKTGTGPFDSNDEPGNDSSEDNNIVRSFDQVTWTVDLTMVLKDDVVETGLTGGIINIEVDLPEDCANVMEWDLESMNWIENGKVSEDGRSLTGQYSMSEIDITIPGKQTLVFVLQVQGAGNKTEVIPTFRFNLQGNEENQKTEITGEKIIVSAKGKYNIELHRNTNLASKTTVDYEGNNIEGRMYGYTFAIQMYNDNQSKGLKGLEYPKGEISFDVDFKLERSEFESEELVDITNECTPILWQYRENDWSTNNLGNIEGRELLGENTYFRYDSNKPLGKFVDPDYSTYNSGDISIVQEGNKLKVTINNYEFNGKFPMYRSNYRGALSRSKIYTDNIGTFSIGYMQVLVPDNGASTIGDRNYYLTVSDSNININSSTDQKINTQMKTSDDTLRVEHVLYNPGSYDHRLYILNKNGVAGSVESNNGVGDGKATLGAILNINSKYRMGLTNDYDIYTANKFIKFDGEGYEPVYYDDGSKYTTRSMKGTAKFRVWYVTKKDGTNWQDQTEMNNGNIEDMNIYENIEDIPEDKICIGVYIETISGYISRFTGDNNVIAIRLKIRETAKIGKTYGITQRTQVWTDELDRDVYSILHPENKYPTPTWDSGNRQYVKTEYDENGEIITGTHNGGTAYGNTVLVIGANLHGSIDTIDENSKEKVNYDLGKNENIVTYNVKPQLDANENIATKIENVTLKAEVTLPQGLTYISGSSKRGEERYTEPEITNNSDGTQKLIWYIYGCASGEEIDPIRFNAQIDNESTNGTQYTTKFVISEEIDTDGISKIGNSQISNRTSTDTINIINLTSHRLYKESKTPVIEKNGQIIYTIIYENKAEEAIPEYQLLDILPYNGDTRGSNFEGTYTLNNIKIKQTIDGVTQTNENLKIYTTKSETVRNMTSKDEGIGENSIWSEKTIGSIINEEAKGIAIKGEVAGKTKVEIEITLNTNANKAENVYGNNAMAQVYKDTEQMQTGTVEARVVNRKIEGKVWEDSNRNGIIDEEEKYLEGIVIKLINSVNNTEVVRTTTNEKGEYNFNDIEKGIYKVEVEIDSMHELTDKEVGTNKEINSKFNPDTKQTDEITKLNTLSAPEIIEDNVNAGIRIIQYNIKTEVKGTGGTISGIGEDIYENVNKGEDSKKDIIVTPDKGYKVSKITVNGEEIQFTEEQDHTVILDKFINMQENKTVVVSFERIEGKVITHHYIEGTKDKVPTKEGGVAEDITQTGYVGEGYETKQAEDIANNYELVEIPKNAAGTIEEGTTEVIYYYKLKTPEIENPVITKESKTKKATNIEQAIEYEINYTTTIDKYIGKATITIVDELPFEIDEEKSTIEQGTYNKANKTITWTQEINNIDTFFNGTEEISITKKISLVYKDIDTTIEKIENKVTGIIKLETPEKEEKVEDTEEIPAEYLVNIEVNKIWQDQENIYKKRPEVIKIELKNGETVVRSANISKENNWKVTFAKLNKYDENGKEIQYTVDEKEILANDLYYYEKEVLEETNKVGSIDEKKVTITNTMTKIPGTVVVKYVDKNTGEEISDEKTKEGIIGDAFDVTEDKKDIEGYTLVEEPVKKTGTYTKETQERIYYYAKNTKVTVKYLEKDDTPEDTADNKVLATQQTLLGYEGETYSTVKEEIEGYTLVETTNNTKGTMQRDEIVVIYFYAKNTKVIVKYLEQDDTTNDNSDNKVLSQEKTIEGYEGKEYTTTKENITGYTFIKSTNNTEGNMTKDIIEVIYYYAKNTKVVVEYLEKDDTAEDNTDNKVLAPAETIEGYEGKEYKTEQKEITNYTFVESTNNTEGKMAKNIIEVIYYYAQNTKATVQHIDRETGKILKEEIENGKAGDLFETHPEDFEGYVLVQEPERPDIIMDKTGEQVVKYYYAHVSAGLIEKHIDVITGNLLDSAEHSGNEGDPYSIQSKTFEGYDLVEVDENGDNMLPTNATGTMLRDEVIEVKYYYIKKATVVVKYVDENTGEEISEEERIEGHENDEYTTEAKDIEDYNLTKTPDNGSGTMTVIKNPDGTYDTEIEVIYYYKKIAGGVIENHIDVYTDKKLATEKHTGNVGDEYDIPSREFEGYDLVTDRLPDNSKGTMTEEEIVVNYYYKKRTKVTVEYIDKLTGEKITEDEVIEGHVEDEYTTEEKNFDGYDLVEKPSNESGEMTEDTIVVKYYYKRKTEVEVHYVEKNTNHQLAESDNIEGYVGDEYKTQPKDIPYYKLVGQTENTEGTMERDKITVIYYYEKQVFNLGIDKWVSNVNVNGINQGGRNINNKDEIYKVDINRSKTETANIKITYKIRVTNKGEIEGTAGEIVEIIPEGYSYYQEDNKVQWEERNGTLITDALKDETIKIGEYKEIEIVLRWDKGEDNFGQKDNFVSLSKMNNPAGYEDINKEDNKSKSSMIITVATGLDRNDRIAIIGIVQIVLVITIGLLFSYKKKEKK